MPDGKIKDKREKMKVLKKRQKSKVKKSKLTSNPEFTPLSCDFCLLSFQSGVTKSKLV